MKTNHGRWFWTLVAVLALTWAATPTFAAEQKPSEDAAVVVNGSVITKADLDREANRLERQFLMMGKPASESQLAKVREKAIENLVEVELLYQQSQKEDIKVDEATVDEQLSMLKKQFAGEDEFKDWLSKMVLSEAEVVSQIRKEMAVQRLIEKKFVQTIGVSKEEVEEYYEKNIKDKLEQQLKQEKVQEEVGRYLEKLKEEAKIERVPEQAPQ